jgi:hypothetical protein
MPLSANTVQISANASMVCGQAGAQNVALRRAAIETIKRGYDKFVVTNAASGYSVRGYTPITADRIGSSVYVRGGDPITVHSQGLVVRMFRGDDPAAADALDARATLGPKWQEAIGEGSVTSC